MAKISQNMAKETHKNELLLASSESIKTKISNLQKDIESSKN